MTSDHKVSNVAQWIAADYELHNPTVATGTGNNRVALVGSREREHATGRNWQTGRQEDRKAEARYAEEKPTGRGKVGVPAKKLIIRQR